MGILSEWHVNENTRRLAWCHAHHRYCPICPEDPPGPVLRRQAGRYRVEMSGVCCQPWSKRGLQRGWLDDRSLPCLVLAHMLLADPPDGVLIECTPAFDFSTLARILSHKFEGDFVISCPSNIGARVSRKRMYMWFDRKRPTLTIYAPLQQYLRSSSRTVVAPPAVYCRH